MPANLRFVAVALFASLTCLATAQGVADAGHRHMLALLAEISRNSDETNIYVGTAGARYWRAQLDALPATAPPFQRYQILARLGDEELQLGDEGEALKYLRLATTTLPAVPELQSHQAESHLRLGIGYLRLGETMNCCANSRPESCILPFAQSAQHSRPEGSRQAIAQFLKVLDLTEPDRWMHREAMWLLNLAAMTIGQYPDGVPPQHRLVPLTLKPEAPCPPFVNIAAAVGVNTFSLAGGAVAEDFDGDGRLDLMVSSADPSGQLRLFRNRGGRFDDITEAAGLVGLFGGLNMVQADYDNDGDSDVLVLRGAWRGAAGRDPNSLLQNDGSGHFVDVTFAAGLGREHFPTQTAAWADFDNDGDLDLYIGNESGAGLSAPSQLFVNQGDGTFVDQAAAAGVTNDRFAKAVCWGDYDHDRYPDLYVSNYAGANRLYRNQGDGTFRDVAVALAVDQPAHSFPAWFWDYDNDGRLDLYVSSYFVTAAELTSAARGETVDPRALPKLYRGLSSGGFEEVGGERNLTRPCAPMSANFGDLDGDGYLDMYFGTGWPNYEELMPNVMYLNQGGRRFAEVTANGGFGHLQKGHAIVFADFDNDGDEDVFQQLGGFFAGDRFYDVLYENPGFGHHWLSVRLTGVTSNRSAIGARIRVDVADAAGERSIYRQVNSGATFGANPMQQMIGLGDAERILRLAVYWPTTDMTQTFTDMPMDRHLLITESSNSWHEAAAPQ